MALAQKTEGRSYLNGGTMRIRVSSLAYTPQRFYLDRPSDIAIMEMPPDFWKKLAVVGLQPQADLPAVEEVVKVWGFPQTTLPQLKIGPRVVMATSEMIALNEPLDGGYSGGPVLNMNDALLGMVLRSTDRQSRVVPSAKLVQALADFERKAVPYREPLEIKP